VAFPATEMPCFALASDAARPQKEHAFQASSPKLSKAGLRASLFFCARHKPQSPPAPRQGAFVMQMTDPPGGQQ
ncbi:hypothetical protein ACFQFS_14195, partial [Novosphingobium lubricantis]